MLRDGREVVERGYEHRNMICRIDTASANAANDVWRGVEYNICKTDRAHACRDPARSFVLGAGWRSDDCHLREVASHFTTTCIDRRSDPCGELR